MKNIALIDTTFYITCAVFMLTHLPIARDKKNWIQTSENYGKICLNKYNFLFFLFGFRASRLKNEDKNWMLKIQRTENWNSNWKLYEFQSVWKHLFRQPHHAAGLWFSLGTLISSTNKLCRHDITDILLNVVLNTLTLTDHEQNVIMLLNIHTR